MIASDQGNRRPSWTHGSLLARLLQERFFFLVLLLSCLGGVTVEWASGNQVEL